MNYTANITKSLVFISGLITMTASLAHESKVTISIENGQRCFTANGLPNHETGTFPNRYNPNGIEAQNIRMCVTTTPRKAASPKMHKGSIGIGINGVQFRPGTAGYYDGSDRRGHSRNPASGWKLEGLNPGNILGMDNNNAHVGPNGLYHYHGVAGSLNKSAGSGPIGYAADGFPIYYVGSKQRSSYQLKKGTRPSGPGGNYDGTYENDFSYVAGSGTLDQCNGGYINGKFAYFATEAYPFLPRCMWGQVSADFNGPAHGDELGNRQRREGGGANRRPNTQNNANQNRANRPQRPQNRDNQRANGNRQGSPRPAIAACRSKSVNAACSFTAPKRNTQIYGRCQQTPRGVVACRR